MSKVYLLDCTLRDGGYVNDWNFGEETIKGFGKKIAQTGVELYEVGFIKGTEYNPDVAVFPDTDSFKNVVTPKQKNMKYVGMLDMSAPVDISKIKPYDGSSIDGIRVIFKKDKLEEAYEYCEKIQKFGYFVSVNFVGTDSYSDTEFIAGIEKFNTLKPYAMAIVDSFGVIKRKQFLRLAYLADNNMAEGIILAYHAHNNLQQAMGNAESLVELNLKRDLMIDACVFGMGRGAGNLNLELFAEYMNENYDTNYKIGPMLEIMDEYLNDIYRTRFWGYSLPLYLSATTGCHPNYAIYLEKKNSLAVKSFNELLQGIPDEDKSRFTKEKAEKYYREYQEHYIDDKETVNRLAKELADKRILLLAPGKSIVDYQERLQEINDQEDTVTIAVNYMGGDITPDYIFSSNMRRFGKIQGRATSKCITTSNMKACTQTDFVINFSSYASKHPEIIDNSGIMLLRLLEKIGKKEVMIAGMDGYSVHKQSDYVNRQLEYDFSEEAELRNQYIAEELRELTKTMKIQFITPTSYKI